MSRTHSPERLPVGKPIAASGNRLHHRQILSLSVVASLKPARVNGALAVLPRQLQGKTGSPISANSKAAFACLLGRSGIGIALPFCEAGAGPCLEPDFDIIRIPGQNPRPELLRFGEVTLVSPPPESFARDAKTLANFDCTESFRSVRTCGFSHYFRLLFYSRPKGARKCWRQHAKARCGFAVLSPWFVIRGSLAGAVVQSAAACFTSDR